MLNEKNLPERDQNVGLSVHQTSTGLHVQRRPIGTMKHVTEQEEFDVLGRLYAVLFQRLLDDLVPFQSLPLLGANRAAHSAASATRTVSPDHR